MPTLKKNSEKRVRVEERNTKYNQKWRKKVKEVIKNFETTVEKNGQEEAKEALSRAFKTLDRAAARNILPEKRAARKKSRLHRLFNEKFSPEQGE